MYGGLSSAFGAALRGPHRYFGYVEAWRGGVRLSLPDGSTRLPLVDGEVQVDGSTPGVRRTLSLTLASAVGLWDLLAPIGTELRPYAVVHYPSGGEEIVPQGVFDVDVQMIGYGSDGSLRITAPDRWVRVQRARFFVPRQFTAGASARNTISTLLSEVMPGVAVVDLSTATATLPADQVEDRDRAGFIQKIATAASLDVYFDRQGAPTIRNAPQISPTSVWTVDAGESGVLLSADRERSRQKTRNIVVVNSTRNDGTIPFATQYVWNNEPLSQTYAGSGSGAGSTPPAANTAGPFGQVPHFYNSPLLLDAAQAQQAGRTILAKVSALAAQLTLSAVYHPGLDDGDTISVVLPPERGDKPSITERHIVDALSVPLTPRAQSITTRSTVADVEEA